jgi:hypothetical protein
VEKFKDDPAGFEADKAAADKAAAAREGKPQPSPEEAAAAAAAAAVTAAALQVLDPGLCLDALIAVLQEGKPIHQKAALHFLGVLLTTTLQLARARYLALRDKQAGGSGRAAQVVGLEAPGAAAAAAKPAAKAAAAFGMEHLQPVMNVLMKRLLHCCYGGNWRGLLGGLLGVSVLIKASPPLDFLAAHEPAITRALLHILRRLPEHAAVNALEVLTRHLLTLDSAGPRGGPVEGSRGSPPQRPREDGLAHHADG